MDAVLCCFPKKFVELVKWMELVEWLNQRSHWRDRSVADQLRGMRWWKLQELIPLMQNFWTQEICGKSITSEIKRMKKKARASVSSSAPYMKWSTICPGHLYISHIYVTYFEFSNVEFLGMFVFCNL